MSNLPALLRDAAPHWPHLQHLDLSFAHLDKDDQTAQVLTAVGQHCPQLKHLDLHANEVGTQSLQALAAFSQLQHLRLSSMGYKDAERQRAFLLAAQSWKQLTQLDLGCQPVGNGLCTQAAQVLVSAGQHWSNLQVLRLGNTWLWPEAVEVLAAAQWPLLQHLELCGNY
jgi:hypothetical protein